jgi:hypothetical protein
MQELTYSEQLRHPNWQRRRLEMLNAAGFVCQCCKTVDKTLHVHHKQYFKGRMAWEYEDKELLVLCEDCHTQEHVYLDELRGEIAYSRRPAKELAQIIRGSSIPFEVQLASDERLEAAASLLNLLSQLSFESLQDIEQKARALLQKQVGKVD